MDYYHDLRAGRLLRRRGASPIHGPAGAALSRRARLPASEETVMSRPSWFLVLVAGAIAAPSRGRSQPAAGTPDTASTPVRATANANPQSAGVLKDGVL